MRHLREAGNEGGGLMLLSDMSVRRPVLAAVLALLLFAFGAMSFDRLPVREYPDVASPVVSVSANYPGASADIVEKRVTRLIESEVSGIEGVQAVTSRSRDGSANVSIEFSLARNLDDALNDVRDRIARIGRRLPAEVDTPNISRQSSDARPIIYITAASANMDEMQLTDFAQRYLRDRFANLPGVSNVTVGSAGGPSMRIWVDRQALAARQLAVSDIEAALLRENIELPGGRLESRDREFVVRVARGYSEAGEFRRLVVARGDDGHLVRLGEVAEVEVRPRDPRRMFRTNGAPSVGMGIVKQSTANTVDVVAAVLAEKDSLNKQLPEGMQLSQSSDESVFIRAAVRAVYWTIAITTGLVGLVMLLFLGTARATVIPLLTIPVCLVAAFSVLAVLGLTINLVTLLALVLCIGLVVDDAIVVSENIYRRMREGEPILLASVNGARQVGFAVIATTAVLVAVFAPVVFLEDKIGKIFAELAVTISAAVIFSSVLALSLVPVLCSKLFSRKQQTRPPASARFIDRLALRYEAGLARCLNVPYSFICLVAAVAVLGFQLYTHLPTEYVPQEDQGMFIARATSPEGTSHERMSEYMLELERLTQPLVDSGDVERSLLRSPFWGGGANTGGAVVTMAPWDQRQRATQEAMEELLADWRDIEGLRVFGFMRSGLARGGGGQPVQLVLGGPDFETLAQWRDIILARARENKSLQRMDADLKETQPQLMVQVDKDRAAELGVSVQAVGRTLEAMLGEREVTRYVAGGEEYDVILQAAPSQRATPDDLSNIHVRSITSGQLIPLANVLRSEHTAGAGVLNRYNRMRAVTLSAALAPGYSLGEALDYLEGLIREELPGDARIDYKGESLEFRDTSSDTQVTFILALLVVFLVLAAQFESFIQPAVIMLTVPLAVAGGLLGLYLTGHTLNIYSQIGIVILIGIATKNGILIVEFINQLRDEGRAFTEAILVAARTRFRPVLMTTVSTVAGAIPLMLASGPGSEGRRTLGVVIFFGVSLATMLTLFVIPVCYRLFARYTNSPGAISQEIERLGSAESGR